MTFFALQTFLMPIAFTFLLILMFLYWGQAAFFAGPKYNKITVLIFQLSFLSLTTLLALRWIDSGHFPLSNLYESLLFLSWSFLLLNLLFKEQTKVTLLDDGEVCNTGNKWQKLSFLKVKTKVQNSNRNYFADKFGLGVILSPMALLTFGFAFLSLPKDMQKATALVPALQSNWLMMHVTVMICSYAALLCGSVLSIAFLILNGVSKTCSKRFYLGNRAWPLQNGALYEASKTCSKRAWPLQSSALYGASKACSIQDAKGIAKSNSRLVDVPVVNQVEQSFARGDAIVYKPKEEREVTLEIKGGFGGHNLAARLDNYSYRILAFGFPLLTIGILSGAVWANEAWGSYWSWDPKETWALITWLVFAIYLHTRITKGWSGERSAVVASLGFFIVWFCYLGVNLLGTGLHSYGWFSNSN